MTDELYGCGRLDIDILLLKNKISNSDLKQDKKDILIKFINNQYDYFLQNKLTDKNFLYKIKLSIQAYQSYMDEKHYNSIWVILKDTFAHMGYDILTMSIGIKDSINNIIDTLTKITDWKLLIPIAIGITLFILWLKMKK